MLRLSVCGHCVIVYDDIITKQKTLKGGTAMTNEMRERVLRAIEESNGAMIIKGCQAMIVHQERLISY